MSKESKTASVPHVWRLLREIYSHPANRQNRLSAVARFVRWQLHKRITGSPLDVRFHGARLRVYPDSQPTSAAYYFNGLADYPEMSFMMRYLRKGDRVLDIGANVGVYSLLARVLDGQEGMIDAFEPVAENREKLLKQFAINDFDNFTVHESAAADTGGTLEFRMTGNSATGHILKGTSAIGEVRQVPCVRLDDAVGDASFALGKMDIEGGEIFALRGATEMLSVGSPPVWILEMGGYSKRFGVRSDEIVDFLKQQGYDCALYRPDKGILEFSDSPWVSGIENVIAVSRTRRGEVVDRLGEIREVNANQH